MSCTEYEVPIDAPSDLHGGRGALRHPRRRGPCVGRPGVDPRRARGFVRRCRAEAAAGGGPGHSVLCTRCTASPGHARASPASTALRVANQVRVDSSAKAPPSIASPPGYSYRPPSSPTRSLTQSPQPARPHMTLHSPSCCLSMPLREMRSRCRGRPFFPARFRSSSLSRAWGKSCAAHAVRHSQTLATPPSRTGLDLDLPAALQYHRLASSRFAGTPMPTSVK